MFGNPYIKLIFAVLLIFAVANVSCMFHFEDMGQHSECETSHHLLSQNVPSPLAKASISFAILLLITSFTVSNLARFNNRDGEISFYSFEKAISPPSFLQEAFSRGILNPKIY